MEDDQMMDLEYMMYITGSADGKDWREMVVGRGRGMYLWLGIYRVLARHHQFAGWLAYHWPD